MPVFQPKTCDLEECQKVFTSDTPADKYCSEEHAALGARQQAKKAKARREAAAAQLHKRKKSKTDPAENEAHKKIMA